LWRERDRDEYFCNLTPEGVALPGPRFRAAFMLSYKGSSLAAIAYVDAEGSPLMFCIIANDAPDAPMPSERRRELSLVLGHGEGAAIW
jgi:hypothetical protein